MPFFIKNLVFMPKSLAAKLIAAIVILIVIGSGISWYALIETGKRDLINEAVKDAASSSELVEKSVRYSMLRFDREAVQRTIDDLKSAGHIRGIKLFDSTGKIYYSSDHGEIGRQVDKSGRACLGCHSDTDKPSETFTGPGQWTIYQGRDGASMLTFITPIYNAPSCSTAACHAHSANQRVLGVLESDFSLAALDESIKKRTITIMIYALALMVLVSAVLYVILHKIVLKPLTVLVNAMGTVAQGDLGRPLIPHSKDEIGLLVRAFNAMTRELKLARERMVDWTASLEREVARKSNELKKSRDSLIEAEKLAALGRLVADVAHEIRNPLTAIGGFARRLQKKATGEKERAHAAIIVSEVDRLEKILRDVLIFSREARSHLERQPVEEFVREVVHLHSPACKEQYIRVQVAIEKNLPAILMDKDQEGQALTNLITNAIDSMPHGGTLTIIAGMETLNDVQYVFLRVSDTGLGFDADKLPMIFEPFYSTKEIGLGTGLGLSITRKIAQEHGGFIRAESIRGEGSDFWLYFPHQSEEESRGVQCWEFMKCGRDRDATAKCPAFPHFGRICWAVAGTFCEGKVQGTFAEKSEDCRKCDFYQALRKEREQ